MLTVICRWRLFVIGYWVVGRGFVMVASTLRWAILVTSFMISTLAGRPLSTLVFRSTMNVFMGLMITTILVVVRRLIVSRGRICIVIVFRRSVPQAWHSREGRATGVLVICVALQILPWYRTSGFYLRLLECEWPCRQNHHVLGLLFKNEICSGQASTPVRRYSTSGVQAWFEFRLTSIATQRLEIIVLKCYAETWHFRTMISGRPMQWSYQPLFLLLPDCCTPLPPRHLHQFSDLVGFFNSFKTDFPALQPLRSYPDVLTHEHKNLVHLIHCKDVTFNQTFGNRSYLSGADAGMSLHNIPRPGPVPWTISSFHHHPPTHSCFQKMLQHQIL